VSSETGSGVVGEGADIRVTGCKVHGCKTHGVAIYGDLLGEFGGGTVVGWCRLTVWKPVLKARLRFQRLKL
jgi:hypothetical protein